MLIGIIGDEMYGHLESISLLQNKHKGCRRRFKRPVVNRKNHFEELLKDKEKHSHLVYRLQ